MSSTDTAPASKVNAIADALRWGTWKTHEHAARLVYGGTSIKGAKNPRLVIVKMNGQTIRITDQQGKLVQQGGNSTKFWAAQVTDETDDFEIEEEDANGPHHVTRETVRHSSDGDAIAVETSRTFRTKAAAQKHADLWGQSALEGATIRVIAGRAPVDSLPGKTPGEVAAPTSHTQAVRRAATGAKGEPKSAQRHPCKCGCGTMVRNLFGQGHDARHVSNLAASYKADPTAKNRASVLAMVEFSEPLTRKLRRSIELIDEKLARGSKPATASK
jgi:hypothetical protein